MKWIKIKNKRVWSWISLVLCLAVWQMISVSEAGAVFASPKKTLMAFITMARSYLGSYRLQFIPGYHRLFAGTGCCHSHSLSDGLV